MSDKINYYQSIPELGIKGRMDTPKEFTKIGLPKDLDGWMVMDIGCNIGAFMVECLKRKAHLVMGFEPDMDWRLIARGVLRESAVGDRFFITGDSFEYLPSCDLVLLLSVLHLVEKPQEVLDLAWSKTRKLLIVEVNDRLQEKKIKLPEGAKVYGKNKDNRTVWHCKR